MKSFNVPPFNEYTKILVCAPQRSGTRFITKAISHDLNLTFKDQLFVDPDNDARRDLAATIIRDEDKFVLMCTAVFHVIHLLAKDDTLVVLVNRSVDDTVASGVRVNWENGRNQQKLLPPRFRNLDVSSCVARRMYFDKIQREFIENLIEIDYDDQKDHPLFIPKEARAGFTWSQIE